MIGFFFFVFFSELAQKTQAERDAKRALHEAGVAKKKEIMAHSMAIQSERQVNRFSSRSNGWSIDFISDAFERTRRRSTET